MSENLSHRVLIDTNVLINDYFYGTSRRNAYRVATDALVYLQKQGRFDLYVAGFSIIQVASTLSKNKVKDAVLRAEVDRILNLYNIIDFVEEDIRQAMKLTGPDLEDVFQYRLSQKVRCFFVLTDNARDFRALANVRVVKPSQVRQIQLAI